MQSTFHYFIVHKDSYCLSVVIFLLNLLVFRYWINNLFIEIPINSSRTFYLPLGAFNGYLYKLLLLCLAQHCPSDIIKSK